MKGEGGREGEGREGREGGRKGEGREGGGEEGEETENMAVKQACAFLYYTYPRG